jgi:hypothetical protein
MTGAPHSKDHALVAAGFEQCADGTLLASAATVTLAPVAQFYRLAITLSDGTAVTCVVADVALKITSQGEPQ